MLIAVQIHPAYDALKRVRVSRSIRSSVVVDAEHPSLLGRGLDSGYPVASGSRIL